MLILLLLLLPLHLFGQPKHLYTSIRGGNGLQVTPRGSYLISTSHLSKHDYVKVEDKERIVDLPERAYTSLFVDVLTDSLVLIDREYVLDLSMKQFIDTLGLRLFKSTVTVSHDRRVAALISDSGDVAVFRISDRMILYKKRHFNCNSVSLSADGEYVMISDDPSSQTLRNERMPLVIVRVSDTTWKRTLSDKDIDACITADGRTAYTTTRGGKINHWDLTTSTIVRTSLEFYPVVTGSAQVSIMTLDASERTLLLSGQKTAIFDVSNLSLLAGFDANVIQVSRDRHRVLLSRSTGGTRLVELATATVIDSLDLSPIANRLVANVACSEDLRWLYSVNMLRIVRHDLESGSSSWTLYPVDIRRHNAALPHNEYLVWPSMDVVTANTGELKYGLVELFELESIGKWVGYDEYHHRYWYVDDVNPTAIDCVVLDPSDTSVYRVRLSQRNAALTRRGEFVMSIDQGELTAYSIEENRVKWSGVPGHVVRADTNYYVGQNWIVARGTVDFYVINSLTGEVADTVPMSSIVTTPNMYLNTVVIMDDVDDQVFALLPRNSVYVYTLVLNSTRDRSVYDTLNNVYAYAAITGSVLFVSDSASGDWFYDMRTRSKISYLPSGQRTIVGLNVSGNILMVRYKTGGIAFYEFSTGRELYSIDDISRYGVGSWIFDDTHKLLFRSEEDAVSVYSLAGLVVSSVEKSDAPTVGTSQISVQVVPNPFTESTLINVTFGSPALQELQVIDITGRVLRTFYGNGSLATQQFPLNSQDLPQGVLFVRATDSAHSHTSILAH